MSREQLFPLYVYSTGIILSVFWIWKWLNCIFVRTMIRSCGEKWRNGVVLIYHQIICHEELHGNGNERIGHQTLNVKELKKIKVRLILFFKGESFHRRQGWWWWWWIFQGATCVYSNCSSKTDRYVWLLVKPLTFHFSLYLRFLSLWNWVVVRCVYRFWRCDIFPSA